MQDFTLEKGKLAIAIAGFFCLFAVYSAITEFKLPSDAQAVEPAQTIVELDPVNIQLLTQTHLFGQPPQVVTNTDNPDLINQRKRDEENQRKLQQQQQQVGARPIEISVTVTGLLASNDAYFSAAVLKVDNKPEKLYRVGEDLGKPEVKLQSVDRDSVVIDNNGNEQTIVIKRPGLESSTSANNGGRNNDFSNFNQNFNEIPEMPPELELPEELQDLNNAAYDGAYTPPLPDPIEFESPELSSLPQDIQDQLLQEQLDAELEEEARAALESELDDHGSIEEPPSPELSDPSSPDFQMPVF